MKTLLQIKIWGDHHHPKWIDYLRIALGMILIWKGIAFILNLDVLDQYLRETGIAEKLGLSISITILAHLIIILHLIGGVCIAVGLRTRLFCLFNLPALLGAVVLVNLRQNIFRPYSEFWLSLIVLLGIICFLVIGNGVIAVEEQEEEMV
ncbi:DoxX family protein [Mucilaginibacter rubeus]|uniref:DoxX family protein n=1 Tax=Mucilaginibacter rubeus TaxID=2027860 RepID=A0AAE6JIW6_9SPHI|nr:MULTISPECIES: DoxX family protein [Mucilaginibacter]QEM06445.1 DoxX family protein [Mucilaginibacter rubeus]QEM19030.1 DoxX family protein [Mucilaginibacter gossypii]QTE44428.1 DoxX family protein [Mucilaginibacter rubeus]QTE51027.1 DoxX family protein [Mucilaginibacter rubeus]QTE56110.1 DoxX family protein [Mucilaginibacter rubeus]